MSPIGDCCVPGDSGCPLGAHATTGWCLVSDGSPVIVLTTIPCVDGEPGDPLIELIDPNTGDTLVPQDVVACSPEISVTVELLDSEVTSLCYEEDANPGVTLQGWQVWLFDGSTGTLISNTYYDTAGNPLVAVTAVECPEAATELTLAAVLAAVQAIDANTDGLEACCAASNLLLTAIEGNTDDIETLLTAIAANVDGLEACCEAGNTLLAAIAASVDDIEPKLDAVIAALADIDANTDGIEACCNASNVLLMAIDANTNGIEALLATIDGRVDGLEACCAAGNALLTAIEDNTDGIEALLTSILAGQTSGTQIVKVHDTAGDEWQINPTGSGDVRLDGNAQPIDLMAWTPGTDRLVVVGGKFVGASLAGAAAIKTVTRAWLTNLTDASGNDVARSEDSVSTNGDAGIPALGVRNDTAASKTSADGDYSMLATDAAGRVGITDLGGSITVDGALGLTNDPTHLEDDPHASGDRGTFALAVRNDNNAVRTSADGDYSPISVDSAGRIKSSSHFAEDTAHASGNTGDFVLGVRNDAAATLTSADGDYSPIATDAAGRIGITDLGGSVTVDVGASVLPTGAATEATLGAVLTQVSPSTSFLTGQATSGVAAAALPANAARRVMVKAARTNLGTVFIGPAGVTTGTGFPLYAGDTIVLAVDNLSDVNHIASLAAQSIAWVVLP